MELLTHQPTTRGPSELFTGNVYFDVIARGEASDLDELAKAIVMPIQSVEGVTRTLTCPVLSL